MGLPARVRSALDLRMPWRATTYLAHGGERTRAAVDLLARVPCASPQSVVDLGCGPGNSTEVLRARWPSASILGLDTSEDMLAKARSSGIAASFVRADVATWGPEAPVDVIFANAVLHWLPEHAQLFPRLMRFVAPGGALAVQMPNNFAAPTHQIMRELAASPPFADVLSAALPKVSVLEAAAYYRLLAPFGQVDLWETTYFHELTGQDPVLSWVRGTTLVPVRDALSASAYSAFEKEYAARLRAAYPQEKSGTTLLPFRRIFVVVQKTTTH